MNEALGTFLAAHDLDDVLSAARKIDSLSQDDEADILMRLTAWDEPQAIANLLMYPKLIAPNNRLEFLLKGLEEEDHPYLKLAAVVGLQSVESIAITEDQRLHVMRMLVNVIETHKGVLSARASATLSEWVKYGDGHAIVPLLRHPDPTVQHNILSCLIQIVGLHTIKDYLNVNFEAGSYSAETIATTNARLSQIKELNPQNEAAVSFHASPFSAVLYSFLPNFSDPK